MHWKNRRVFLMLKQVVRTITAVFAGLSERMMWMS
jgi:hypothetical protein